MTAERNINITGNVTGTVITTGDNNQVTANIQVPLQPADSVDIHKAVINLQETIKELITEPSKKLTNALDEAIDEVDKVEPDKVELAESIGRVAKTIKNTDAFIGNTEKLVKKFGPIISWLGVQGGEIAKLLDISFTS